jgi:GNAT superfamily N-acetyltransferase
MDEIAPGEEEIALDSRGEGEEEAAQPLDERVIAIAEEPGLWMPDEPTRMAFHGDGFSFAAHGRSAWVQRLRLPRDDAEVERVVNHVDAILSIRGIDEAVWWLGELTTPRNLGKRLLALGLEPDDPPRLTSLTITKPPAGAPGVEVRQAETLEDWLSGLELDWECFCVEEAERELRRREAAEAWPALRRDDTSTIHLAYLDGEPVGFGRTVYTPFGALMLGGATLPAARGRGVYTSLVQARWAEAVTRGVPRLVVAAGPGSAPILERLGFDRIGRVRLFRQKVT